MTGRATRGPKAEDVLGRVTLVTGKEELLNERTVGAVRDAVRRHDAEAEISETQAAGLTLAELGEMSAPSLFSSTRCVVVRSLENLPDESVDGLLDYAAAPADEVALVLVHGGGPKGSGVLTKLRKLTGRDRGEVGGAARLGLPGVRHRGGPAARRVHRQGRRRLPGLRRRPGPALAGGGGRPADQRLPRRGADGRQGPQVLRRPSRGQVVRGGRRRLLGPPARGPRGAALGHRRGHGARAGHLGVRGLGPRCRPLQGRVARDARGRPGPRGRGAAVEAAHDPRPVARAGPTGASRSRSGPWPRPTPTSRARPATRRTRSSGWC